MNNLSKWGILGGTFDPVHRGHVELALCASKQLNLQKILFCPNATPPHKKGMIITPISDRLDMLSLALQNFSEFAIEDCETSIHATGYTIDTIRILKNKYPNVELLFLLGSDNLVEFASWKKGEELIKEIKFILVNRASFDVKRLLKEDLGLSFEIVSRLIENEINYTPVDISSSKLREMICSRENVDEWMDKRVLKYIQEKGLYL